MTLILVPGLALGAVEVHDFEVKTTQDLIDLCTVPPDDMHYREAIHFCHGYLVGAYHYHVAETSGLGSQPLVCLPNPAPSAVSIFD